MLKVYAAGAMTGLSGEALVERSIAIGQVLSDNGITVLDPVACEGVKPTKEPTQASFVDLTEFWRRDKALIRDCHVLFDVTPERKSEGVAHEIAYARYHLWKPVIRVYMNGSMPTRASVAFLEDDVLVSSLQEACDVAIDVWGTPMKRLKWRLSLYRRCLLKAIYYKAKEWVNVITN